MTQQTYYRPEWTCGRYNPQAQVALMYNLIEGKSFFFESYSATVISEILSAGRNGQLNIESIANNTGIATESIIEFIEGALIDVGLVTTKVFTKDEIRSIRKKWSALNKVESPHYNLSNVKTEGIIDPQTAEMEYKKYLDVNTQVQTMQFELTYRCSEQCLHCYNMGATRNDNEVSCRGSIKELSLEDYKRVIDELDSLGCYKVCLTGGDPFSHPHVWGIIDYLYQKEIAFDVFTNGQSITTNTERLVDYYPRVVGLSVYSGIDEIHDRITRIKGSLAKTLSVAKTLSDYGVPMAFKCVVMKPNLKSYHLVKDLAREYGAVIQIEANLCMGVDGDMSMINHLRLSKEEFEVLLRDKDISIYVGLDTPNEGRNPKPFDALPCGGGWGSYTLTPNGKFVICVNAHWELGDIYIQNITSILKGQALKEWRSISVGDIDGCGTKPECDYCNICGGNNYSEHGVLTKPSSVNCWMAEVRYGLMQKLKDGEDTLNGLSVTDRLQQLDDNVVVEFGKEIKEH